MATLVSALRGIEPPREVDADETGIPILAVLGADIDTAVCRAFRVLCMQNVIGENGNAETPIFQELLSKT